MDNLENLTSAQLSNLIDEKEKELSIAIDTHQVVEQEKLHLQKTILELQTKKKDLEIAESKAGHNIRQLSIGIKILKNKFWSCKNSGI